MSRSVAKVRFAKVAYQTLIFGVLLLVACTSNKKLKQENAEKAIKEVIASKTDDVSKVTANYKSPCFNVQGILKIEPVMQFSESEATCNVIFMKNKQYNDDLALMFAFKKDINNQWYLTGVGGVKGFPGNNGHVDMIIYAIRNVNVLAQ